MLAPAPPDFVVSCDVCGTMARTDVEVGAPPGFVRLDVHPRTGLGVTHHVCLGNGCLVTLAHRLRRDAARVVSVPR